MSQVKATMFLLKLFLPATETKTVSYLVLSVHNAYNAVAAQYTPVYCLFWKSAPSYQFSAFSLNHSEVDHSGGRWPMSLFLFSSTLKIILTLYLQDIVQKQWINVKFNHPFVLNPHWSLLTEKALILIVKMDPGAWSGFHLHMLTTLPFNHSQIAVSFLLFYFQIYIYLQFKKKCQWASDLILSKPHWLLFCYLYSLLHEL